MKSVLCFVLVILADLRGGYSAVQISDLALEIDKIDKIDIEVQEPPKTDDNTYKIVCNFNNQAWYRPDNRKYTPEHIDRTLCTHIVYNTAVLDPVTLKIKIGDPLVDIQNGFYKRITEFKKAGIPVLISIGGNGDATGDTYSRMLQNPKARNQFIVDAVKFIKKYNFDGMEYHAEFPACWRTDCYSSEDANEIHHLTYLARKLSEVFKPHGYLLSIVVSPLKNVIPLAYDVPELSKYVDWISVMTYHYHGSWEPFVQHYAEIGYAKYSVRDWIQRGAPSRKILMGLPTIGGRHVLEDEEDNDFGAPAKLGGGEPGEYTQHKGCLSFYEIIEKVNASYHVNHNNQYGTFAHFGTDWISYDDVRDIQRKCEFIREENLGGAMIQTLDQDEFLGNDNCGKYPLLRAANQVLRSENHSDLKNCI